MMFYMTTEKSIKNYELILFVLFVRLDLLLRVCRHHPVINQCIVVKEVKRISCIAVMLLSLIRDESSAAVFIEITMS